MANLKLILVTYTNYYSQYLVNDIYQLVDTSGLALTTTYTCMYAGSLTSENVRVLCEQAIVPQATDDVFKIGRIQYLTPETSIS